MNERTLRPGNVATAAVVLGGVLVVGLPQHAVSIVQLVIVTIAAAAGLYALAVRVPPTGWISPFRWMSPFHRAVRGGPDDPEPGEVESIRSSLSGWRQRIGAGPPMPPETLRLLRPLVRVALDLDPENGAPPASVRPRLSSLTWAVLTSDPGRRPPWFRRVRPDDREVADAVHRVLDDLDRLVTGGVDSHPSTDPKHPRAS